MWVVGTPDACRNSRPSRLLKTSRWPLAVHTGHVWYDHHSELSKSVKRETSELPTIAGTPYRWNSRRTNPRKQLYHCWANTGYVWYCQTSKKRVSSFVSQTLKTHMGWHEHLWIIIYQHDASLLIVRHTYQTQDQMKNEFIPLELISFELMLSLSIFIKSGCQHVDIDLYTWAQPSWACDLIPFIKYE